MQVFNLMNEKLLSLRTKNLLNIGTCNLHIIHNAFLRGLEEHGEDVSDLVIKVYYYFKNQPLRWQEFEKIQQEKTIPAHHFIKHVSSRWLTLQAAAERIIEQFPALLEYFLKHIPKNKPDAAKKKNHYLEIIKLLKNPSMKCELLFVISSANLFSRFTAFFQRAEPLVHLIYNKLCTLLYTLMGRFLKPSCIPKSLGKIDGVTLIRSTENWLSLEELVVSETINCELKKLKNVDRTNFLASVRKHYLSACEHILMKSSISKPVLRYLTSLKPPFTTENGSKFLKLAALLPIEVDLDVLKDEWVMIQHEEEKLKFKFDDSVRIDKYWEQFFQPKYSNIAIVVKSALSLVHGSADIERNFSVSGRIINDERTSMKVRMLNSILIVKDVIRLHGYQPHMIFISKKLVSLARVAYLNYQNYLNAEKEKKKNEERKIKDEIISSENLKKIVKSTSDDVETDLKHMNNKKEQQNLKRTAVESLFEETNKRLKTALEMKDFSEVHVASALMESLVKMKKEETSLKKEVDSIQKNIDHKKTKMANKLKQFIFKK